MSRNLWNVGSPFSSACITLLVFVLSNVNSADAQEIEFERNLTQTMLNTTSKQLQENFYDQKLHGLNWMDLTDKARVTIEKARVPAEMLKAVYSLVNALNDSHTMFLPPQRTLQRHFGFEAMAFGEQIRINAIDDNGAAAAAGLQVGDWLLTINATSVTPQNIHSIMLYSEVLLPVDAMEVTFYRENNRARSVRVQARISERPPLEYVTDLPDVYQLLQSTSSPTTKRDDSPRREVFTASEGRIVYLRLPFFPIDDSMVPHLVGQARNADAVILDLRGNPGGSLTTMQYLAGFFETRPITMAYILGRTNLTALNAKPHRPNIAGPLLILVDSRTASAAEIFARHFQRSGRAVVVGDRTAGRVSASRIFSNHIGSKLVISYGVQIASGRIIFDGGEELEGKGVMPDQSCIPITQDLREHRDICLATALELARKRLDREVSAPSQK